MDMLFVLFCIVQKACQHGGGLIKDKGGGQGVFFDHFISAAKPL
jgi:hypothetical protein